MQAVATSRGSFDSCSWQATMEASACYLTKGKENNAHLLVGGDSPIDERLAVRRAIVAVRAFELQHQLHEHRLCERRQSCTMSKPKKNAREASLQASSPARSSLASSGTRCAKEGGKSGIVDGGESSTAPAVVLLELDCQGFARGHAHDDGRRFLLAVEKVNIFAAITEGVNSRPCRPWLRSSRGATYEWILKKKIACQCCRQGQQRGTHRPGTSESRERVVR